MIQIFYGSRFLRNRIKHCVHSPEVCGNAAIYFDPYSIYEIKNRILQLSDKEIYNECSKNGLERFAYISEIQKKDLQRLSQIILQ